MKIAEVQIPPEINSLVQHISDYCDKHYGNQPLLLGLMESLRRSFPDNPTEHDKDVSIEALARAFMIQSTLGQLGQENLMLLSKIEQLESDVKKLCTMIDMLCSDDRK
jgi:hypothetical protein